MRVMTELGFGTLSRGRRSQSSTCSGGLTNGYTQPDITNNNLNNLNANINNANLGTNGVVTNGVCNGNGCLGTKDSNQGGTSDGGVRTVHDGFATIRAGGGKRGRARSSPSVVAGENGGHMCGGCNTRGLGAMEPLWEEQRGNTGGGGVVGPPTTVTRRDRPTMPWWEVATRRSRYRSCPAFTQASMVTALEQTMNTVTSKLERLASSPDLKDVEAAELRRTAAVLRQQSSAVCQSVSSGYFSMERQLSSDSVSSVNSTVSTASCVSYASLSNPLQHSLQHSLQHTLQHKHQFQQHDPNGTEDPNKFKKRSWLRSSFRRAFGRHSRKRSKQQPEQDTAHAKDCTATQELPLNHSTNAAVRQLPLAPPPQLPQPLLAAETHSQHSLHSQHCSASESQHLPQLHAEVAEKERALTDCRLEVLSAQSQLQVQAEHINRLQAECTSLREENTRLASLVRGQYGPAADALITPLSHTFTSLTLSRNNPTGSSSNSVGEGRRMHIVVIDQPYTPNPDATSLTLNNNTHIGNINIEPKTTWNQLDNLVNNTLKDYGNRVDPVSGLGLEEGSVRCYRVAEALRTQTGPRPELLPYGYCVGDVDALHCWLKDGSSHTESATQGSCAAAAFASATPVSVLQRLSAHLVEHRRLVLAGPPQTGKTHLAHTLARYYVLNAGKNLTDGVIKTFSVTGSNSLELCQLLSSVWPHGKASVSSIRSTSASSIRSTSSLASSSSSSASTISTSSMSSSSTVAAENHNSTVTPIVIIIDDLHAAGGVVELLQRCLPAAVHAGPAIIATSQSTPTLATRLHIHCNFRWSSFSVSQEPVRGLLGRVLRQRVVVAEVGSGTRLPDHHQLAEWLTRLWLHLNTILTDHCAAPEVACIGPGIFMDCPLGQEEAQVWFTEVWNGCVIPALRSLLLSHGSPALAHTWADPLDWVIATYPWPSNAACGPDHLIRLSTNDVLNEDTKNGNMETNRQTIHRSTSTFKHHVPYSQGQKIECVYAVPHIVPRTSPSPTQTPAQGQQVVTQAIITPVQTTSQNIVAPMQVTSQTIIATRQCPTHNIIAPVQSVTQVDNNTKSAEVIDKDKHQQSEDKDVQMMSDSSLDKIICDPFSTSESMKNNNQIDDNRGVEPIYSSIKEAEIMFMETDPTESGTLKMESTPSLEVTVRNAINMIGGSAVQDIKIIRDSGNNNNVKLKGLAQELTTTFKPVETAI